VPGKKMLRSGRVQKSSQKVRAMLYYKNLWTIPQVYKTAEQQSWFKYKYKTYSNEASRPVIKYIMHKNTSPLWVSNTKTRAGISKQSTPWVSARRYLQK
jgi:hypothetical protein